MVKTRIHQRGFIAGNIGGGIFFIALVVWVLWFLSASHTKDRLERVCRPVYWMGNIIVSTAELTGRPESAQRSISLRDNLDYDCRYLLWKQFYYDEWLKLQQKQEAEQAEKAKGKNQGRKNG